MSASNHGKGIPQAYAEVAAKISVPVALVKTASAIEEVTTNAPIIPNLANCDCTKYSVKVGAVGNVAASEVPTTLDIVAIAESLYCMISVSLSATCSHKRLVTPR